MTEIAVLVKQVPDIDKVRIGDDGTLVRAGVQSIMDPFGKMALMTALRYSERSGGRVTAITMGPPQAIDILKECIAYGADDAVLITDRKFAGSDTLATSKTIASFLSNKYDIIFCGMQATDGDTAQVPAEVAVLLEYNFYPYVQSVSDDCKTVIQSYERNILVSSLKTPAVISVAKSPIGCSPLPTLDGYLKSISFIPKTITSKELNINDNEIGISGSETKVVKIRPVVKIKKNTQYVDESDAIYTIKKELGI